MTAATEKINRRSRVPAEMQALILASGTDEISEAMSGTYDFDDTASRATIISRGTTASSENEDASVISESKRKERLRGSLKSTLLASLLPSENFGTNMGTPELDEAEEELEREQEQELVRQKGRQRNWVLFFFGSQFVFS